MNGKKVQYYLRFASLLLLILIVSMNMLNYEVPNALKYVFGVMIGIYLFLVFKNRYR